ncbi:MAG: sigma-70 family RNA polymerase sigma factor [Ilumatobacteraceae bacterium]
MHVTLYPPPTNADRVAHSSWNEMAFGRYARTADPSIRDDIAAANTALAAQCARQFLHRGEPFDDLQQVARLGLVLAIDRFDLTRGVPFGAYATATMMGELRRHFRDRTWGVHVPRRVKDVCGAVTDATSTLHGVLGRDPTIAEVAVRTRLTEATVVEVQHALAARRISPLTATALPVHTFGAPPAGDVSESVTDRVLVGEMLGRLGDRDRRILELSFYEELTQAQIAEQLGLSQVHVGRLLAHGLAIMRAAAAVQSAPSN